MSRRRRRDLIRKNLPLLLPWAAIGALALLGWWWERADQSPTTPPALIRHRLVGVTVVLDPGHGGADSGAICRDVPAPGRPPVRLYEATINYRLAAETAALLRAEGANVVWTVDSAQLLPTLRPGDLHEPPLVFPADAHLAFNGIRVRLRADSSPDDLYRRAAITQPLWRVRSHPNDDGLIFLSIHCDKFRPGEKGHGARVYRDKREPLCPRFASILKRRLTDAGLTNSRGGEVIAREYGVLNRRYNAFPERALVEAATLSDSGDRRAVQSAAWRWRMAHLLVESVVECEGR